jgi:hypothetical protein
VEKSVASGQLGEHNRAVFPDRSMSVNHLERSDAERLALAVGMWYKIRPALHVSTPQQFPS